MFTEPPYVRFCGRYWGQSGHWLLRRTCPLMTQSGHRSNDSYDSNEDFKHVEGAARVWSRDVSGTRQLMDYSVLALWFGVDILACLALIKLRPGAARVWFCLAGALVDPPQSHAVVYCSAAKCVGNPGQ